MNTPTRLAVFAAGLAVVFVGAVGVGNAVGPVGTAAADPHGGGHSSAADAEPDAGHEGGHDAGDAGPSAARDTPVTGLSVSTDGYTLQLESATAPVGTAAPFAFTITGPDGQPVTDFTPEHDKELHLIVVRRDTTGFQHVHPTRDPAGRWSVPLTLGSAGAYKVFTDFVPDDRTDSLTLAADFAAAGSYEPQPLPAVSRTATVEDYTVTLDGDLTAGTLSELTLSVSRGGQPVTDLQPYLAAYGHLVALRAGDLAYLHVHPDGKPGDGRTAAGPGITFYADVPTAGDYRLYLDFQHDNVVRTAEFTATAGKQERS
ncbi:MAG: hypothetical protein KY451_04160 [Actinobacteria bacterium]|nr:hypothetical protein [Actinomycetota bacterium]